jgi:hypothetical protein
MALSSRKLFAVSQADLKSEMVIDRYPVPIFLESHRLLKSKASNDATNFKRISRRRSARRSLLKFQRSLVMLVSSLRVLVWNLCSLFDHLVVLVKGAVLTVMMTSLLQSAHE